MKRKLLLLLVFAILVLASCMKQNDSYNNSGTASTTDNTNKIYMPGLNLASFSAYVGQSYTSIKSDLDVKYKDTALIVNGNEQLIVYVQDQELGDRYYALVIYQSNSSIYAVNVQNISDYSTSELWDKALALADSTVNIAGNITQAIVYNGSSSVYSSSNLAAFKSNYQLNNSIYSSYAAEIYWNDNIKSHAVLVRNSLFYWLAQKGNVL